MRIVIDQAKIRGDFESRKKQAIDKKIVDDEKRKSKRVAIIGAGRVPLAAMITASLMVITK